MKLKIACFAGFILLNVQAVTYGQKKIGLRLDNQFSGWSAVNFRKPVQYFFGGRYLPSLTIVDSLNDNRKLDAELSVNTFGNVFFAGNNFDGSGGSIQPYRFWVRYSTPHFELRLGLQKINFGSASIFRPLMWFDRMDVRDPLQLTDGVYGILGRYYFQKNTNIWLWSLYGNNKPIGLSQAATRKQVPEIGGRIQQPVPRGDIAFTFHHRQTDYSDWYSPVSSVTQIYYPENKAGLDGKWDVGAGLWFEYVVKHNAPDNIFAKEWETYFNIGFDYMFAIGNGLNATTEFFRYKATTHLSGNGQKDTFTALSANYPFGLMNTLTTVVYYNWEQEQWSRFLSLQRKYDYWSFYIMAYWNPDNLAANSILRDRNLFAGKGIQIMTVVNF